MIERASTQPSPPVYASRVGGASVLGAPPPLRPSPLELNFRGLFVYTNLRTVQGPPEWGEKQRRGEGSACAAPSWRETPRPSPRGTRRDMVGQGDVGAAHPRPRSCQRTHSHAGTPRRGAVRGRRAVAARRFVIARARPRARGRAHRRSFFCASRPRPSSSLPKFRVGRFLL